MQLSIGFWSFKALKTAYELDVFTRLSGADGVTVTELADALGSTPGIHRRVLIMGFRVSEHGKVPLTWEDTGV